MPTSIGHRYPTRPDKKRTRALERPRSSSVGPTKRLMTPKVSAPGKRRLHMDDHSRFCVIAAVVPKATAGGQPAASASNLTPVSSSDTLHSRAAAAARLWRVSEELTGVRFEALAAG